MQEDCTLRSWQFPGLDFTGDHEQRRMLRGLTVGIFMLLIRAETMLLWYTGQASFTGCPFTITCRVPHTKVDLTAETQYNPAPWSATQVHAAEPPRYSNALRYHRWKVGNINSRLRLTQPKIHLEDSPSFAQGKRCENLKRGQSLPACRCILTRVHKLALRSIHICQRIYPNDQHGTWIMEH